jgi:hypothetical protein
MMRSTELEVGTCPFCQDDIYIFRTQSRSRVAKCINEECPVEFAFGIPKKGSLEVTALYCPKPVGQIKGVAPNEGSRIQILAVIPNQYIKQGTFRSQTKKTYFWAKTPCFVCNKRSTCEELAEAKEEFTDE